MKINDLFKDSKKIQDVKTINNLQPVEEETVDELEVGDTVKITGNVQFNGRTGEIKRFGQDKKFVVVSLYSGGDHSFHSSDVTKANLDYEDEDEDEDSENDNEFYVVFYDEDEGNTWIGAVYKDNGKWREDVYKGTADYRWGGGRYMSYLTADDVMRWISKDYSRGMEIAGPFNSAKEAEEYAEHNFGEIK